MNYELFISLSLFDWLTRDQGRIRLSFDSFSSLQFTLVRRSLAFFSSPFQPGEMKRMVERGELVSERRKIKDIFQPSHEQSEILIEKFAPISFHQRLFSLDELISFCFLLLVFFSWIVNVHFRWDNKATRIFDGEKKSHHEHFNLAVLRGSHTREKSI